MLLDRLREDAVHHAARADLKPRLAHRRAPVDVFAPCVAPLDAPVLSVGLVDAAGYGVDLVVVESIHIRLANRHERVVRHYKRLAENALAVVVLVGARTNLAEPHLLPLEFGKCLKKIAEALEPVVGAAVGRLRAVGMVDDVCDLVDAIRHRRHELRRIAVEVARGEVCVALDLASGEHAVSYLRDVGVELEELGDVDAELDAGPDLDELLHDLGPMRREFRVTGAVVGLVAELEAGDDVLVLVVDDPLDEVVDSLLVIVAPAFEGEDHLEAVLLPELERGVGVGERLAVLVLLVALLEPGVGAPHALEPGAGVLHRLRGLEPVVLEPVGVGVGRQSVAVEAAAGVADDRSAGRFPYVLDRLPREVEVDLEVRLCHPGAGQHRNRGDFRFCVHLFSFFVFEKCRNEYSIANPGSARNGGASGFLLAATTFAKATVVKKNAKVAKCRGQICRGILSNPQASHSSRRFWERLDIQSRRILSTT